MALARTIYSLLFRRTSTFAVTIVLGAVLFERAFDQGGDALFEQINRGVSGGGAGGGGAGGGVTFRRRSASFSVRTASSTLT